MRRKVSAVGTVRLLTRDAALLALPGLPADARPGVPPGRGVVGAALGVPSGEDAVEVFGVGELLGYDSGRVGVGFHVLLEIPLVLEDVVDDPAQESDVGPGPDRHVQVRDGAGAGVTRVHVDDLGAPKTR